MFDPKSFLIKYAADAPSTVVPGDEQRERMRDDITEADIINTGSAEPELIQDQTPANNAEQPAEQPVAPADQPLPATLPATQPTAPAKPAVQTTTDSSAVNSIESIKDSLSNGWNKFKNFAKTDAGKYTLAGAGALGLGGLGYYLWSKHKLNQEEEERLKQLAAAQYPMVRSANYSALRTLTTRYGK